MSDQPESTTLGNTTIEIPLIGTGTWQWGDRLMWGFGNEYNAQDAHAAFDASLEMGINFFDTAEVYGMGRSERFLGEFLSAVAHPIVVATKFFPYPWRLTRRSLLRALRNSLERLGLAKVDLYQIHMPNLPKSIETWANALADAVDQDLVKAVGVSNYNLEQMCRSHDTLYKRGIPLASNQVQYNLLDRKVEFNGLLKSCQELGVTLIAYSPLAKGVLTGKYTPDNPLPGLRGQQYNRRKLEEVQPFIRKLRKIGRDHDEKTCAQVSINWLICKGVVPIPGAKNIRHVLDNAGALGWRLTDDEIAELDEASQQLG